MTHITSWLDTHPKEQMAILLHHRYLRRALDHGILKGADLWLFEMLKAHFDIEFVSILITSTFNPWYGVKKLIDVAEVEALPLTPDDLESLLTPSQSLTRFIEWNSDGDENGNENGNGNGNENRIERKIKTTLFLGKRTQNLQWVDHVPPIEYTGNDARAGQDSYMTSCMVLKSKAK